MEWPIFRPATPTFECESKVPAFNLTIPPPNPLYLPNLLIFFRCPSASFRHLSTDTICFISLIFGHSSCAFSHDETVSTTATLLSR